MEGSTDIRAALDRLQGAFDLLGDRYRDLRRERKMLRDQLDAERQEREQGEASMAARLERAAEETRRADALAARINEVEDRSAALHNRIVELEESLQQRDATILRLEDAAAGHTEHLESERGAAEALRSLNETQERELAELREELSRRSGEIEELRSTVRMMEAELATRGADAQAGIEQSRTEIASWSARYEREREERLSVEEKQLQTIAKLDAATRAEAQARTEAAQAAAEVETMRGERDNAVNEQTLLREMLRDVDVLRVHAESERERADRAEHLANENHAALEAARGRITQLEAERAELETTKESGGEALEALRVRLTQAENDMAEALDLANRYERERNEAEAEREEFGRQVARLTEEIAVLHTSHANGSANGLSAEENRKLVEQIDAALRLIDEQLGES